MRAKKEKAKFVSARWGMANHSREVYVSVTFARPDGEQFSLDDRSKAAALTLTDEVAADVATSLIWRLMRRVSRGQERPN